jgi:hypothetical protein
MVADSLALILASIALELIIQFLKNPPFGHPQDYKNIRIILALNGKKR